MFEEIFMNETIQTLLDRKSIRSFLDKKVSESDLIEITNCAKAAPTARNRQQRQFVVVRSKTKIQKLAKAIAKEIGNDSFTIYNCPVLIIVSVDEACEYGDLDSACAIENIYIACQALGLGSVWINQLRGISYVPSIRKILDSFQVPKNHVVWAMSAIGYPSEIPEPKERTEKVVFID